MSDQPDKPMTKTELLSTLAEATGLTKQQVNQFFDELTNVIANNLREDGPGVVTIPGLMKVKVQRKPAKPEYEGIHPFTKEPHVFKAQPAKNVVKLTALKKLKDLIN